MFQITPLLDAKAARAMEVVRLVDANPGISRAELSAATGLGPTTIVRTVGDLIEDGVLAADTPDVHGRAGRPTERLNLRPEGRSFVGIEFGPGHLAATVMDAVRTPIASTEVATPPAFATSNATLDALAGQIRSAAERAGVRWSTVAGVGVALHGVVTADGIWEAQGVGQPPIAAAQGLVERLGRPVVAEDVSRAFALAEQRFGAGRHRPDLVYLFLGMDGVGGGIYLQGAPMKSTKGICGEIGHLPVEANGTACACGASGCLETVATRRAIVSRYRARAARAGQSGSTPAGTSDFRAVAAAAGAGDEAARVTLEELAHHLACALGPTVNITGATHIVIGGGVDPAGESLRARTEDGVRSRVVGPLAASVSVAYAELSAHAGAWGAALQAMESVLSNGRFLTPEPVA